MMRHKKKLAGAALFFLSILFTGCYFFLVEPKYDGAMRNQDQILIIAHRGFGNFAPDNSASAVRLAFESGLDGVDLDTQLTADGELVIFHDPTVDRLTDGTGRVDELTLQSLRLLDMGSKFDEKFDGERIRTFGEMIEEVDGKGLLIAELKSGGIKSEGIEEKAIREIQNRNAHSFVYLSSFNPFVLYRLKKLDPDIRTVFIFRDVVPYDPTQFTKIPFFLKNELFRRAIRKVIRPDLLSIETTVKAKTIESLRKKGYPILLWTPNNESDIKKSLEMNPFAIITDEPLIAMSTKQN